MTNIVSSALRSLAERRAAKQARESLERDLAEFRTRADILDFEATLDRLPDEVTKAVRVLFAAGQALRG
jgi:hypothetical protein